MGLTAMLGPRPGPNNTGTSGALAGNGNWGGSYTHTAPITIDGYNLTSLLRFQAGSQGSLVTNCTVPGQIDLEGVNDITISNCEFDNAGSGFFCIRIYNDGNENFLIEDCTFIGPTMTSSSCAIIAGDDSGVIQRCEFSEPWGDAMKMGRSANGIAIRYNWIHHIGAGHPTAHGDGIQAENGGLNLDIYGNYFDMPLTTGYNHNAGYLGATDAVGGDQENVNIHHNWFDVNNQEIRFNDNGAGSILSSCHIWNNRHFGNDQNGDMQNDATVELHRAWGNVLDSTGASLAYNTHTTPP